MRNIRKEVGSLIISLEETRCLKSDFVLQSPQHAKYLEDSTIELIQEKAGYPIGIAIQQSLQQAPYLISNIILRSICKAQLIFNSTKIYVCPLRNHCSREQVLTTFTTKKTKLKTVGF